MWRTDSLEKTLMLGKIEAGGGGDDRGRDGWMASLTQWTWVCVNSGSWWWTGRPGLLQFMGLQRVGHVWGDWTDWLTGEVRLKHRNPTSKFIPLPFCLVQLPLGDGDPRGFPSCFWAWVCVLTHSSVYVSVCADTTLVLVPVSAPRPAQRVCPAGSASLRLLSLQRLQPPPRLPFWLVTLPLNVS